MNEEAFYLALIVQLVALIWPDAPNAPVFNPDSIDVIADNDNNVAEFVQTRVAPHCMIIPGAGANDDEEPTLIEQRFSLQIVTSIAGDAVGTSPIMGAAERSSGESVGKGLLEITRRALQAVALLEANNGITIISRGTSRPAVGTLDLSTLATRRHEFTALLVDSD